MLRLVLSYITRAAVIAVPFVLGLFNKLPAFAGWDEKRLGAAASLAMLCFVFIFDAIELYIPRQLSLAFRDEYLTGWLASSTSTLCPWQEQTGWRGTGRK